MQKAMQPGDEGRGRSVMSSELLRVKALMAEKEVRREMTVARGSLYKGIRLGHSAVDVFRE